LERNCFITHVIFVSFGTLFFLVSLSIKYDLHHIYADGLWSLSGDDNSLLDLTANSLVVALTTFGRIEKKCTIHFMMAGKPLGVMGGTH
jgi:hypothetical protein